MTAFVAKAFSLFPVSPKISAATRVAGPVVAMQFIGWLPYQVIAEPNLRGRVIISRLIQLSKMRERIKLRLRDPRPCALLALVRQSPPLPRRHPHPFGEDMPECRNRLISDRLGDGLGADLWLF